MTTKIEENYIPWDESMMVEILLSEPDDFLKLRETLTRIGVASRKEKTLYQSVMLLHKRGHYYVMHFKELFAIDQKPTTITQNDLQRRNRIVKLLSDWGLLTVVNPEKIIDMAPLNQIKVISYKEKSEWSLVQKYTIGGRKQPIEEVTAVDPNI